MCVYVFAMLRDQWSTHCLDAKDLKMSVSAFQKFSSFETMLKALRNVGADETDLADFAVKAKGVYRGSITIDLVPNRKNLLAIFNREVR